MQGHNQVLWYFPLWFLSCTETNARAHTLTCTIPLHLDTLRGVQRDVPPSENEIEARSLQVLQKAVLYVFVQFSLKISSISSANSDLNWKPFWVKLNRAYICIYSTPNYILKFTGWSRHLMCVCSLPSQSWRKKQNVQKFCFVSLSTWKNISNPWKSLKTGTGFYLSTPATGPWGQ